MVHLLICVIVILVFYTGWCCQRARIFRCEAPGELYAPQAPFFTHSYSWGAMTSSIFRIIFTTWVASSSCCFLDMTDSKMPCSLMLVVP